VTLQRVEASRAGAERLDGLPKGGAPSRIVVVDDNADVREGLHELLVTLGHEVYQAQDGPSGVNETLALKPNFALIDIGLPGFDGFEVARRIRAGAPGSGIVLIAVTGYGQRESRQAAMTAGFDHYLVKPIDFYQLAHILDRSAAA
jgi:CheY-like chemotaxis protein